VCGNGDISFCDPSFTRKIIKSIRTHVRRAPNKTFYLQSKQPEYWREFLNELPENVILVTTLETNRDEGYEEVSKAPVPTIRYNQFTALDYPRKVVTIEPVMDFDVDTFAGWIIDLKPEYVWLGFNSRDSQVTLPEPSFEKMEAFTRRLVDKGIELRGKTLRGMKLPIVKVKRANGSRKQRHKIIEFKDGLPGIDEIETIPISDIDIEDRRLQYRVNEKINNLRQSLCAEGQLVPVILWNNGAPYKIIDGFRRVSAIKMNGWKEVKAIVYRTINEDDAYRLSFIENFKRKSFTPLDIAHAVWKATARGKTNAELTSEFNITERQLQRYREILTFSDQIKNALSDEFITMAHAKVLNDFKVKELNIWIEKIKDGLSAANLRKELKFKHGTQKKTKQYIKKNRDGFRIYELRYGKGVSSDRRAAIRKALEEALAMIKADEEKSARTD